MLNTESTIYQFVFLVYQLAVCTQLPPTPWTETQLTVDKRALLLRQGWKNTRKGRMQMCLRFDLPDGVAYLGNGDLRGCCGNSWHGRIEGLYAENLGYKWIEFGVTAEAEVELATIRRKSPFLLRPRSDRL